MFFDIIDKKTQAKYTFFFYQIKITQNITEKNKENVKHGGISLQNKFCKFSCKYLDHTYIFYTCTCLDVNDNSANVSTVFDNLCFSNCQFRKQ